MKRALTYIIIIATVILFGRALLNNWNDVKEIGFKLDLLSLLAIFFLTLAVIVSGFLWGRILHDLDSNNSKKISDAEFIKIHIGSWLLKYIPGQLGSFLGKVSWGISKSFSKKTISVSFLYENIFLVFASLILSLPLFIISTQNISNNLSNFTPLFFTLPFLIVFNRNLFYKLINFALKTAKREQITDNYFLNIPDLVKFLILYTLPRILNAIGFIIIAVSLFNITSENFLLLGSTYILAGIIGLLAVFVPSGIGVREAIIVIFLGSTFGTTQAIILSIYARFFSTIADFMLSIIYITLDKIFINSKK